MARRLRAHSFSPALNPLHAFMSTNESSIESQTLLGHPTGLFTLFFAEMWERFSYYGMRSLLVFYMIKGFLGYNDSQAYGVYAAYGALVYATPFIGGMLADRLLGAKRAVVLGGLLMAAGHLAMTVENETVFFIALALLICGNGFFKPNISTIVGGLYPKDSPKKDTGFTIFYMGINLGAALSPVICGYIGETYGWHYGFGLATAGMLVGVAIFVAPTRLTQGLILVGALGTAGAMPFFQDSFVQLAVRLALAAGLAVAGMIAIVALERGGLPKQAGAASDPQAMSRKILGFLRVDLAVLLGVVVAVPLLALLVSRNSLAGVVLTATGIAALSYILFEAIFRSTRVECHRVFVLLVLMFFSMLFWAFFEQAGSSVNNFTDRNIDRVAEIGRVSEEDIGTTLVFRVPPRCDDKTMAKLPRLTQEQLGYPCDEEIFARIDDIKARERGEKAKAARAAGNTKQADQIEQGETTYQREDNVFTITHLAILRDQAGKEGARPADMTVSWTITQDHVGMGVGGSEIPASEFQAANPIFIVIFGLVFSTLWSVLATMRLEPSTPVKFSLGLLQLGLAFAAFWYGATQAADSRGMVSVYWLLLGYLLQTTGELCLSPVGLSMVTRLSPGRIVSTIMGAWFLATAFSNYLAGAIAMLTGVSHGGAGDHVIPPPVDTVDVYGNVFGWIAWTAVASALFCFIISPLLSYGMHHEVEGDGSEQEV